MHSLFHCHLHALESSRDLILTTGPAPRLGPSKAIYLDPISESAHVGSVPFPNLNPDIEANLQLLDCTIPGLLFYPNHLSALFSSLDLEVPGVKRFFVSFLWNLHHSGIGGEACPGQKIRTDYSSSL